MKLNIKKALLIVFVMFGTAMFDNVRGVFLNIFKDVFSIDYKTIGLLMFASSLAYMMGSLVGGFMLDVLGKAKLMRIAAVAICLGVIGTAYSSIFSVFMWSYMTVSFFTAVAALIINTTIPELNVKNHAFLMNLVHFLYGLGATITIKASGILIDRGWTYTMVYMIVLGAFVALLVLSFFVSLPETNEHQIKQKSFTSEQIVLVVLFSIALGTYLVAELQTGTWFISYASTNYNLSENSASTYLSIFFAVFSIGRLFGGLIAHRVGYLKSVTISLSIGMVIYFIGLFMGEKGLMLIAFSGAFFSIGFPTIVLSFKRYFPQILARANGTIMFFAALINVTASYLLGYVAESVNTMAVMYVMPSSLIVSVLILILIQTKFLPKVKI